MGDFLDDRYLLKGENKNGMFFRVATKYSDNSDHSRRLYNYMCDGWFMPSTPILSNAGTNRGLPISCFVNETEDSLNGIVDLWTEHVWLSTNGGGIGSYWGNLRSIGQEVRGTGKTSGIIPFIGVQNSLSMAISQGLLRRGSTAVYLDISHPEIEEFLEIRKPVGGDANRKSLNIHHGIIIPNGFMDCLKEDSEWELRDPKTSKIVTTISARYLWQKILLTRLETGEPYIMFRDNVNNAKPEIFKILNLDIKTSNLCAEIMLPTGKDYKDKDRTAVCCLASVNIAMYDEWKNDSIFIEDVMRMLDNVLTDFIHTADKNFAKCVYAAKQERSVGLGVMGFHTYLQQHTVVFGSAAAEEINDRVFKYLKSEVDKASCQLAKERGSCPDAIKAGVRNERFVCKMAVAPTASISIINGNVSAGIDPMVANIYVSKTLNGSTTVKNQALKDILAESGNDTDEVWRQIMNDGGSVQNLECLSDYQKEVFKTAFEINQYDIITLAAARTKYICQSQSVNLFLDPDITKSLISNIHFRAWKLGIKSLYYVRSKSIQRPENISCDIECNTCQ